MHTKQSGGKHSPMARRLRLIRLAMEETNSSRWAKRIGWSVPQLSNYENGVLISRDAAIKMANNIDGLTTDYILRDKRDGLTLEFLRRLEKAEAALAEEEGPKVVEMKKNPKSTRDKG
jgi:transcriptional regulator with XRE-family HTH domain